MANMDKKTFESAIKDGEPTLGQNDKKDASHTPAGGIMSKEEFKGHTKMSTSGQSDKSPSTFRDGNLTETSPKSHDNTSNVPVYPGTNYQGRTATGMPTLRQDNLPPGTINQGDNETLPARASGSTPSAALYTMNQDKAPTTSEQDIPTTNKDHTPAGLKAINNPGGSATGPFLTNPGGVSSIESTIEPTKGFSLERPLEPEQQPQGRAPADPTEYPKTNIPPVGMEPSTTQGDATWKDFKQTTLKNKMEEMSTTDNSGTPSTMDTVKEKLASGAEAVKEKASDIASKVRDAAYGKSEEKVQRH